MRIIGRTTGRTHRIPAAVLGLALALAAAVDPAGAQVQLRINGDYTVDDATNTAPQVFTEILVGDGTSGSGVGTLTIRDGRLVRATNDVYIGFTIGFNASATGTVDVAGSASRLETTYLYVGFNGNSTLRNADGFLNIGAGGRVRALEVRLSGVQYASHGTVTVSGPGALLEIDTVLELNQGGTSRDSIVTIGPGGTVSVGTIIQVTTGTPRLVLDGGTLSITGPSAVPPANILQFNSGSFRFRSPQTLDGGAGFYTDYFGSPPVLGAGRGLIVDGPTTLATALRLDGGSLRTERVVVTPGSGSLILAGGTLTLAGERFVIGDGSDIAVPAVTVGDGAGAAALLELAGAGDVLLGAVTVAPDGAMTFGGESLFVDSLDNSGSIAVADAALRVDAGLLNAGSLRLADAVIEGDVTSPAGSSIDVAGTVFFNGRVAGAAAFHGGGTAVFNGPVSIE
jgi:T5SS/PEP-CTERM-associated repeat protein